MSFKLYVNNKSTFLNFTPKYCNTFNFKVTLYITQLRTYISLGRLLLTSGFRRKLTNSEIFQFETATLKFLLTQIEGGGADNGGSAVTAGRLPYVSDTLVSAQMVINFQNWRNEC